MHELFVHRLSPPRAPLSASEKEKPLASPPRAPPSASEKKWTAPAPLPCTSVSARASASASGWRHHEEHGEEGGQVAARI